MRFAQIVFTVAGIWGIVVLAPFYWLVDVTGVRFLRGGTSMADRISRDRVEPKAVPSADDSRDD